MRLYAVLFLLVPTLLAAECQQPAPEPRPAPPPDPAPPPPPPDPTVGCAEACTHLRELRCPQAQPTEAGASCEQVCANVNASGTLLLDTKCVVQASSCDAADRCVR